MEDTRGASDDWVWPGGVAIAGALVLPVLVYTLVSGTSILLGLIVAGGLGLFAVYGWCRRRGWSTRPVENAGLVSVGALVLLYALLSAADPLLGVGTLALLWIGVTVARIERHLRPDDADA